MSDSQRLQEFKQRTLDNGLPIPNHNYKIGDTVETKGNVLLESATSRGQSPTFISKGTRLKIADILIVHKETVAGYTFRLVFDEYPDHDFRYKKFRKAD